MNEQKFPSGWNEARVKRLIDHYENMSEDELLAEDEAAREAGKNHLPVTPGLAKVNGKIKGSRRQKKAKQPRVMPASKRRKRQVGE